MVATLISVIITLILVGVIWWAVQQLLPLIPLPEPIARIVYVLMVVLLVCIVLWVVLALLAPLAGVHVPSWVR
jgi:hypothetical protein